MKHILKEPCVHGELCRAILKKHDVIYSQFCPDCCEYYEPKKRLSNIGKPIKCEVC